MGSTTIRGVHNGHPFQGMAGDGMEWLAGLSGASADPLVPDSARGGRTSLKLAAWFIDGDSSRRFQRFYANVM